MMKKTFGGERLGSGGKMQVELHGYERSTHDLSYIWKSSMSAGTLVPFLSKVMLPGDTFDINLQCEILTLPTIGPLFGSYKVQLDVFQVPMRLYNAMLHNNMLEIGLDMSKVKIPIISFDVYPIPEDVEDVNTCQVNPSCILSYLGIRGFGNPGTTAQVRSFNAIPLLGYWDIYKQYYSNKQEKIGAVIHAVVTAGAETIDEMELFGATSGLIPEAPGMGNGLYISEGATINVSFTGTEPSWEQVFIVLDNDARISIDRITNGIWEVTPGSLTGTISTEFTEQTIKNYEYLSANTPIEVEPQIVTFDLSNIDAMRTAILAHSHSSAFEVNDQDDLYPYLYLVEHPGDLPNVIFSQEGLGLKTYNSDLFNNWLETEFLTYISNVSAVSTASGSFTMDQFNLSRKVYEMLNRIAVSGGTYNDWIDTVYAVESMRRAENPMYMGGLIKELVFQEVISNSETTGKPLGTLAGRGRLAAKHKGGNIYVKVDEPSYVMGIVSITPRIDYSQGNEWDIHLETFDDFHKPQLDQIGFQDLLTERLAWWDTEYTGGAWVQKSAGKQPAWVNYMTDVNKTYGNFAMVNKEMFMTLNRRYERDETTGTIKDLTTYIDPVKCNYIFAESTLDAQNFWVQIGCNITARRKMSAKIMPNL